MKRSIVVGLTIMVAPALVLCVINTRTLAATRPGSTSTPAQKVVKAKDSPQTQRAKAAQRAKELQRIKAEHDKVATIATGTWAIDPLHSMVGFAVRHVLINEVHGTFDEFEGTIVANAQDVSKSSVQFTAKVASINTRVKQRDDHLRSPDFFDAAKYPELSFKSTRIERVGLDQNSFRATGVFTMHGVSKTISFPFHVSGPVVDGFGYTRAGIQATLLINRQDYGVKWNQVLDHGGLAVDNIVRVNLDLEAVKAGTGPKKEEKKD